MRSTLGMWKCECCNFSNPKDFDRCSYCGLAAIHTMEELEKYKQSLPSIRSKDQNIWASIGSTFLEIIFTYRRGRFPVGFLLLFALLLNVPFIQDHFMIAISTAAILSLALLIYFRMKK